MKPQILCFGELLVDMIATNTGRLSEVSGFEKKFGGAPANTACGLSKLGIPVSFMGKVGNDPFGHFLAQTLKDNNVDTAPLLMSNTGKTTLAFVSLTKHGERDFVFYKGAHELLEEKETQLPENVSILHFGSLTQIHPSAKAATQELIAKAKKQSCILSYDPNVRESLWIDLHLARKVILETAKKVDVMKVNEEEAALLAQTANIEVAAEKLFFKNLDALFITLGSKGCFYKTKKHQGIVASSLKVKAIDTTGAGDAFNAGYLSGLFAANKKFSDMTQEELLTILKRANTIAALTTTKKGAITAFPDLKTLKSYNL